MGLARDLTMGPKKKRTRVGFTGDFATLRRMTAAADPDITAMKETILRVGASPTRLRPAEGAAYSAACRRYREITGEPIGPEGGTY